MNKKIMMTAAFSFFTIVSIASDWPYWRGPDRDGIAKGEKWNPDALKSDLKILWKADLGVGYSIVAVKDGRVYSMGNKNNNDTIYCFDEKTGKKIWEYSYACPSGGGYPGPRSTPVVTEKSVLAFSREGDLVCVDSQSGSLRWKRNVQKELGAKNLKWGLTSSPCVVENMVIVNAGQHGMAFDLDSGKDIWKNRVGVGSYAVAVPFKNGSKDYVAIFGEKELFILDQKDASEIDSAKWETKHDVNAPDPLIFDGGTSIFITSGYGTGCALFKFKGGKLEKAWQNKNMSSHFSSPVILGGYIYGIDGNTGNGNLVCIDPKTGDLKWKQKTGFGSLVAVDSKLIYLNEIGEIIAIEADPGSYKEISRAKSGLTAKCWTMPVLSNGRLYCRNDRGDLLCIDLK